MVIGTVCVRTRSGCSKRGLGWLGVSLVACQNQRAVEGGKRNATPAVSMGLASSVAGLGWFLGFHRTPLWAAPSTKNYR